MFTQHLAVRSSGMRIYDAFESQPNRLHRAEYLSEIKSVMFDSGCTQAIVTSERGQAGPTGSVGFVEPDRRKRCPRASNFLPCWVSSQAFPPAVVSKKKNSLLSIPSRLASSPCTPANTSNRTRGRAPGSALFSKSWPFGATTFSRSEASPAGRAPLMQEDARC